MNYKAPREHLFEQLGLAKDAAAGLAQGRQGHRDLRRDAAPPR